MDGEGDASVLAPFRFLVLFFFFGSSTCRGEAAETNTPSTALEIFLLNFCGMFYLGGFCVPLFYYLDIFIPPVTIFL